MKSPRIQHSKPPRKPVTIDLGKDEVTRVADETEASPKAASAAPDSETTARAERPVSEDQLAAAAKATGGRAHDAPDPTGPSPKASGSKEAPRTAAADQPKAATGKPKSDAGPPSPAPAAARSGTGRALAAGIVGGLLVLAAGTGAYYAGLLPQRTDASATADIDVLRNEIEALRANVAALPQEQAAPQLPDLTPLEQRMAALESEVATLRESAANAAPGTDAGALESRLSALEQAMEERAQTPAAAPDLQPLQNDVSSLSQSLAALEAAREQADTHANESDARLGELASRLSTLEQSVAERAERPGMALAIAASALKSAIDRGTPFMTELETYAAVAPDAPAVAQLRDMAATGVPTRAAIEAELPAAATAMIAADQQTTASDAGLVDRLMSSARSLVTVRPVGMVEGPGTEAVVARLEAHVRGGDYAAAVREYETLPTEAQAAGSDLMNRIHARQAADELTATALAAALRQ